MYVDVWFGHKEICVTMNRRTLTPARSTVAKYCCIPSASAGKRIERETARRGTSATSGIVVWFCHKEIGVTIDVVENFNDGFG